jgi:hypothetical protein
MLAFSNDYYGMIFRATQSVELFCAYVNTDELVPLHVQERVILGFAGALLYKLVPVDNYNHRLTLHERKVFRRKQRFKS